MEQAGLCEKDQENMSEFSSPPNTAKKIDFPSLVLSDLFLFCSLLISHPLYFSYFIFFSPYIIKILSFLSPLFATTSLLLLALFTTFVHNGAASPPPSPSSSENPKLCFLLSAYRSAVEKLLRCNPDDSTDEACQPPADLEALEAYMIVFDTCTAVKVTEMVSDEEDGKEEEEAPVDKHLCCESNDQLSAQGKIVGGFLEDEEEYQSVLSPGYPKIQTWLANLNEEEEDEFVDASSEKGDKEVEGLGVDQEAKLGENSLKWQSRENGDDDEFVNQSPSLGSFGSMRKEKEWRRTLACKLFEERHNNSRNVDRHHPVEGSEEGMDMLWETYEPDQNCSSNKQQQKQQQKQEKQEKQKQEKLLAKSTTVERKKLCRTTKYDGDGDGDDYEEIENGKLCCLQALKFSAGKMNLGMGRPNLVKISKAFKGIGWLHHATKRGKKVHP